MQGFIYNISFQGLINVNNVIKWLLTVCIFQYTPHIVDLFSHLKAWAARSCKQAVHVWGRNSCADTATCPHCLGMLVSGLKHRQCALRAAQPHMRTCQNSICGCVCAFSMCSHTYMDCLHTALSISCHISICPIYRLQALVYMWIRLKPDAYRQKCATIVNLLVLNRCSFFGVRAQFVIVIKTLCDINIAQT